MSIISAIGKLRDQALGSLGAIGGLAGSAPGVLARVGQQAPQPGVAPGVLNQINQATGFQAPQQMGVAAQAVQAPMVVHPSHPIYSLLQQINQASGFNPPELGPQQTMDYHSILDRINQATGFNPPRRR